MFVRRPGYGQILNQPSCFSTNPESLDAAFAAANEALHDEIPIWQGLQKQHYVIAETRFSYGLKALLTWFHWLQNAPESACLHYLCCTRQLPDKNDVRTMLANWPMLAELTDAFLAVYPEPRVGIEFLVLAEGRIRITFMQGEPGRCFADLLLCGDVALEAQLRRGFVDTWFVDEEPDADLQHSMALLSGDVDTTAMLRKRRTPWAVSAVPASRDRRAIVLGAGLAGCFSARALAMRGWQVWVVDAAGQAACGASGNPQGILYPMVSSHSSLLADFMSCAYNYAWRYYRALPSIQDLGELNGMLQLLVNDRHSGMETAVLDAQQASRLAGIPLSCKARYLPHSGWLDTPALCAYLLQTPGIQCAFGQTVEQLVYDDGQWQVGGQQAGTLILANGFAANTFEQTRHLPLIPNAGQQSFIASNQETQALRIPLCGDGHVLPSRGQQHMLGASYHPDTIARQRMCEDDAMNLARLPPGAAWSDECLGSWFGTRATTPDYFPLLGPVPLVEVFQQRFAALATDRKRWIAACGEWYPGLYLLTGFGSRGLASIPLCAQWLAAQINQEPCFFPHRFANALSPARFLVKAISQNTL